MLGDRAICIRQITTTQIHCRPAHRYRRERCHRRPNNVHPSVGTAATAISRTMWIHCNRTKQRWCHQRNRSASMHCYRKTVRTAIIRRTQIVSRTMRMPPTSTTTISESMHRVQRTEILGECRMRVYCAVGLCDVQPYRRKYAFIFILTSNSSHSPHSRSESPSSQRSSPPISPGCEDQMHDMHDPFKKPFPPMRPQEFPPFYSSYPYHLMQHGSSAFHRPLDASGKPIPVSSGDHQIP